jgi:hypothetical protein
MSQRAGPETSPRNKREEKEKRGQTKEEPRGYINDRMSNM